MFPIFRSDSETAYLKLKDCFLYFSVLPYLQKNGYASPIMTHLLEINFKLDVPSNFGTSDFLNG